MQHEDHPPLEIPRGSNSSLDRELSDPLEPGPEPRPGSGRNSARGDDSKAEARPDVKGWRRWGSAQNLGILFLGSVLLTLLRLPGALDDDPSEPILFFLLKSCFITYFSPALALALLRRDCLRFRYVFLIFALGLFLLFGGAALSTLFYGAFVAGSMPEDSLTADILLTAPFVLFSTPGWAMAAGSVLTVLLDALLLPWRKITSRLTFSEDPISRKRFVKLIGFSGIFAVLMLAGAYMSRPKYRDSDHLPPVQPPVNSQNLNVLFVGNSLTISRYDIPEVVAALARAAGQDRALEPRTVVHGGFSLKNHLELGDAPAAIRAGGWDYVVLQEGSWHATYDTRAMYEATEALVRVIRESSAKPLLYMTWCPTVRLRHIPPTNTMLIRLLRGLGREFDSADRQALFSLWTVPLEKKAPVSPEPWIEAYLELGQNENIPVAPVGVAWRQAMLERPKLQLYQESGSHPSENGAYLSACVLYSTLYGKSPEGLPNALSASSENPVPASDYNTLSTSGENDEPRPLIEVSEETAAYLQRVAWDAVRTAEETRAKRPAPPNADTWYIMGVVHIGQKHYDEAIKAFEHCLDGEGDTAEAAKRRLEELKGMDGT